MSKIDKPLARRGVLGLLSSLPFAAKDMAQSDAAKQAGLQVIGTRAKAFDPAIAAHGGAKIRNALIELVRKGGKIPARQERRWRSEAKYNGRLLDADIASLRSISVATKVRMQEERNYARIVALCIESQNISNEWKIFTDALGLNRDRDGTHFENDDYDY